MPVKPEPVWLDEDEICAINAMAVNQFGGLAGEARDENLLKAALGRPLNKWHYDSPKPDLFELAAAYCFALIRGHAFVDGNKRTAYIAAIVFLELNGYSCVPDQADIIDTMLAAAAGSIEETDLTHWFGNNSKPIDS